MSRADQVYQDLFMAWKKAYPYLSGPTIRQSVSKFWTETFTRNLPNSFLRVQEKILQLQGSKSQPKLTYFWNKVLEDQNNTNQLGTSKPTHLNGLPYRVNTKNNKNFEPIVITIDDDQDEVMTANENVLEPLVVLEVFRLESQSSKTSDTIVPLSSSLTLSTEQVKGENLMEMNTEELSIPAIKTEIEIASIEKEEGECSESEVDEDYKFENALEVETKTYDIRIIKLEKLMETNNFEIITI